MKITVIQDCIDILRGKKKILPQHFFYNFKFWLYNHNLTNFPSSTIRHFYLTKVLKYKIPKSAFVHLGCFFNCTNLIIGENTVIGRACTIVGDVTIGKNCSISAFNIIQSVSHDKNSKVFEAIYNPVIIEDYVWTGYNSVILDGSYLRRGCIIGACSLITGKTKTEECGVYGGVPAKKISERDKDACVYNLNYHPVFC